MEENKPSRSLRFFTGLLLVVGILSSFSVLTLLLHLGHLGPGTASALSVDVLNALTPFFFLTAYFALKKRSPFGRWIAVTAFTFAECDLIWALSWYLIVYNGPKSTALTAFVIGLDIIQFVLFGWGALTFAFPPNPAGDSQTEFHLPPPPPTFHD